MSRRILAFAAVLALAPAAAIADDDRAPTPEERAQIEQVLRAEGYTRWDEIELDDGVWEVDDAIGADGREYDLELDRNFRIIKIDD